MEFLSLVSLLCARNCSGSFARVTSLNPLSNPARWVLRCRGLQGLSPGSQGLTPCPGPHGSTVAMGESHPCPLGQSL